MSPRNFVQHLFDGRGLRGGAMVAVDNNHGGQGRLFGLGVFGSMATPSMARARAVAVSRVSLSFSVVRFS